VSLGEELKYVLGIEPDTTKIGDAMRKMGHDIDEFGRAKKLKLAEMESDAVAEAYRKLYGPGKVRTAAGLAGGALGTLGAGLGHGLGAVGTGLGAVASGNPLGAGFDAAGASIKGVTSLAKMIPYVGELFGQLGDQLQPLPGILKEIISTLVNMASVASPGEFRRYQMAIEDLQGTIGIAFLPYLQMMTDSIRDLGNVFASDDIQRGLAEIFASVRDIVTSVGPDNLHDFVAGLIALTKVLIDVTHWVYYLSGNLAIIRSIIQLISMIGHESGLVTGGIGSSAGAAARQAQFTSADQYQKQIQIAAFTERGASMSSVPSNVDRIASNTDTMVQLLNYIWNRPLLGAPGTSLNDITQRASEFGAENINKIINRAETGFKIGGISGGIINTLYGD
jgi:hypothetical protein